MCIGRNRDRQFFHSYPSGFFLDGALDIEPLSCTAFTLRLRSRLEVHLGGLDIQLLALLQYLVLKGRHINLTDHLWVQGDKFWLNLLKQGLDLGLTPLALRLVWIDLEGVEVRIGRA